MYVRQMYSFSGSVFSFYFQEPAEHCLFDKVNSRRVLQRDIRELIFGSSFVCLRQVPGAVFWEGERRLSCSKFCQFVQSHDSAPRRSFEMLSGQSVGAAKTYTRTSYRDISDIGIAR